LSAALIIEGEATHGENNPLFIPHVYDAKTLNKKQQQNLTEYGTLISSVVAYKINSNGICEKTDPNRNVSK
jgi:hypothetical protein